MKKLLLLLGYVLLQHAIFAQRNVILLIADDLGSDYCGFYENHLDTVKMPNVRKLLAKGVRFKNAWSNPLCSPTRAGMLTGRYSFRTGVGNAVGGGTSTVLDTGEMTIPRMLNLYKPNGFAKANIGKWHLHLLTPTSNYNFPNQMGYDHFEGNFSGVLNSFIDWAKVTNGKVSNITNYATTETVDNAVSWIKKQQKPFFLWMAFNAPHTPYHLPPLNLHSYQTLSGTSADITANPVPYFKAATEALDREIGRLFDSLSVLQKMDSTDFIFIGDNGDDPMVAQNKGGAKGSVYQEGVSVPFIIAGPSVVNPGRVSDALVNTHDLFATILELFGYANWKQTIAANRPVDSKSILPILKATATTIRPWAFVEVFKIPTVAGDGKAMRNESYKLLDFDNGTQKFFKLSVDPTENKDLLLGTMSPEDQVNYTYLCNEMTNLVGKGGFCVISAIEEKEMVGTAVKVSPNPFSDYIVIQGGNPDDRYRLFDAKGSLIFDGKELEKTSFRHLSTGSYFLEVVGKKSSMLHLIKQ